MNRLRLIAFALFASIAVAPVLLSSQRSTKPATTRHEPGNLVRQREAWFYGQREHPLGYIPAGARLKALAQAQKMRRQIRALASTTARTGGASAYPASVASAIALAQAVWTMIGPEPTLPLADDLYTGYPSDSGRVTALAFDPRDTTDKTIYLGAVEGGLWVTTSGGQTWMPLTDSLPSLAVGSIALDPTTIPTTIYIGTGEENFNPDKYYGAGVLKSTDGGNTWTQDQTFSQVAAKGPVASAPYIGSLAVAPDNSRVVLAAVSGSASSLGSGVWRSTDGGNTWALALVETEAYAGDSPAGTSVAFDSGVLGQAFAVLGDPYKNPSTGSANPTNGIYESTDDGATWKLIGTNSNFGNAKLALAPPSASANGYIIASVADASTGSANLLGVYAAALQQSGAVGPITQLPLPAPASDFCGDPSDSTKGQCSYDMALAVSPVNPNIVYLGGTNDFGGAALVVTSDGAGTWSTDLYAGNGTCTSTTSTGHCVNAGGQLHTDTHAIAFSPDGQVLAIGNDGGVWTTQNVGAYSNVAWNDLNATLAITQFYPGISILPGNPSEGLGGTQDNGTQKYVGSIEWRQRWCGDGAYNAIDPSGSTDYMACAANEGLFSTRIGWAGNGIGTCTAAVTSNCYRADFVPPLALDPESSSTLYFGAQDPSTTARVVYQTTNGALSWQPISPDLSGGTGVEISSIAVAPTSSNVVYAGNSRGGLYFTSDASAGAGSAWFPISSSSLPNRAVTDVVVDPSSPATAYVAYSGFSGCAACDQRGHIFEINGSGTGLINITGNLPDIPVNALVVDPALANTIYAATDVGVFATFDGGNTWAPAGSALPNVAVLGLTLDEASRTLWAGTHGRSMWALQLPQPPTATVSPTSVTFPPQSLGTSSSPKAVTITNNGAEALEVSNIAMSGGFSQTNNCGSMLAANSSCTVEITFTPSTTGAITGTLSISDNLRSSPATVALGGTGVYAGPMSFTPGALAFGAQGVGTSTAAQDVALTNTAASGVSGLSVSVTGDFTETNACGTGLGAGANCSISVKFAPSAAGSRSGTLTISGSYASSSLEIVVALYGYGTTNFTAPAAGLGYVPVTPCRVADSRSTDGPLGGPAIAGGTSRDFAIRSSACGIPSTAAAYSLNVAVVPGGPLGYLTLWPTGTAQPLVATLNSVDGRVKSNAAIVPAGVNGAISVYASNGTDVVIDINGYFVLPSSNPNALAFYPLTPCRVADTRNANGQFGGPMLTGGQSRTFPIQASACAVPAAAQAYSLNFAAVPTGPLGYLTAWPTGQTQPYTATLNAVTGMVTANAAIVPAGTSGEISVYASNDTNLVIDINGYFAPAGTGGLSLYALAPCRVIDTRQPAGSPPFSRTINVNVAGSGCGAPVAAQAFVFNATVVPSGGLGYLTLWPAGTTQPVVATLNAVDGAVTNNMAVVPTTNGSISAFASNPTYLVLDVFGYFGP